MEKIEEVLRGMNPVEGFVLAAGIALTFVLAEIFRVIVQRADSRKRKRFWLILITFFVFTMIRLTGRSLKFLTPDVNLFIDSLSHVTVIIYILDYVHKAYVATEKDEPEENLPL